MIAGVVRGREALIRLTLHGSRNQTQEVEAVIDTGYTASLSLPPGIVTSLGLRWRGISRGILADGSECLFDVFVGKIECDGKERTILIDEADADPLVGMTLLAGHERRSQVRPRGKVTIKKLRRR